ncbi:MAG: hypothetical protein H7239_07355 [Flavobacterium sp.]|nr:hypothetical protein [Flavobacterium sp.]
MSKKTKAFLFQLLSFAVYFIGFIFIFKQFLHFEDIYIKILAFVAGTILAPKFQAVITKDGEKLYMKWIFLKGIREIK